MGAWIETDVRWKGKYYRYVAPFVGAWIETEDIEKMIKEALGRSLRGSVD